MSKKRFVRLKDAGTMFSNTETAEDISGVGAKAMTHSERLQLAIKGGALIELADAEEANAWNKLKGVDEITSSSKKDGKAKTDGDTGKDDSKKDEDKKPAGAPPVVKNKAEIKQELIDSIKKAETVEAVKALLGDKKDTQIKGAANARIKELNAAQ